MRWSRPLSIAPAALLLGAAPYTEQLWYAIAAEDGTAIGYGYSTFVGPLDAGDFTDYREFTIRRSGKPDRRFTDRVQGTLDAAGRPRVISEHIDDGGEVIDIRTVVAHGRATITRTANGDTMTKTVATSARVFAYDSFAPSRCVPPTKEVAGDQGPLLEIYGPAMTIDWIVDGDMGTFDKNGVRWTVRQRFSDGALRTSERMGYDGDCHLVEAIKEIGGVTVRLKPVSRAAALAGKP